MAKEKVKRKISRREFLIAVGVAGGGLLLGTKVGLPFARLKVAELFDSGAAPGGMDADATAWFLITPDNTVKLFIPKSEMGQGVHTALAQIAAEELEIEWQQLEVVQAGTGQGLDDGFGTGASNSVSTMYQPLREAAATMRQMLRIEAARILDISPNALTAQNCQFISSSDKSITYGEIAEQTQTWEIPETTPSLKSKRDFRFIGESAPRVDLREKILGKATFGYDRRLPDMLYGATARPPKIGSTLKSAQPGEAASRTGVVKIVIEDDFAGVVAENREQAYGAANALSLEWNTPKIWQQADIDALVTVGQGKGIQIQKEGDPEKSFAEAPIIEAEYRTPMAFHAHLEPQSATVDVKP
ncbi:MAG: molybdopterin-dependent oxidoreductase, partial [Chloroflexi bacterium]|nr:molybdopterin-dependent oxidoreductase [Chloroflexota bacterium]